MVKKLIAYRKALRKHLLAAGLPGDFKKVIGQKYIFACEHGSHHQILAGTIESVRFSDEGGLDLHVSATRFWGEWLICLKYDRKWHAVIKSHSGTKNEFYPGALALCSEN